MIRAVLIIIFVLFAIWISQFIPDWAVLPMFILSVIALIRQHIKENYMSENKWKDKYGKKE